MRKVLKIKPKESIKNDGVKLSFKKCPENSGMSLEMDWDDN